MNPILKKELEGEVRTITGSVFLRNSACGLELPPGKKMMTVMGVILVDEKDFPHEGETMTQVVGYTGTNHAELLLVNGTPLKGYEAYSADRLFCENIWRA